MKLTLLSIALFFFLSFQKTYAQEDYVITHDNDTLKGNINHTLLGQKFKFKQNGQSDFIKITVKFAKEFYKKDERLYYCAKIKPGKSKAEFLKRLENGRVQLFEYDKASYSTNNATREISWYASKDGGPLMFIKTSALSFSRKEKEQNFYELIGDDVKLLEKFKLENDFSNDMLRKYIKLYNKGNVVKQNSI